MNLKKRQRAKRNRPGGSLSLPQAPTGPVATLSLCRVVGRPGSANAVSKAQNRVGPVSSPGPGVKGTTKAECQASMPAGRSQPAC